MTGIAPLLKFNPHTATVMLEPKWLREPDLTILSNSQVKCSFAHLLISSFTSSTQLLRYSFTYLFVYFIEQFIRLLLWACFPSSPPPLRSDRALKCRAHYAMWSMPCLGRLTVSFPTLLRDTLLVKIIYNNIVFVYSSYLCYWLLNKVVMRF